MITSNDRRRKRPEAATVVLQISQAARLPTGGYLDSIALVDMIAMQDFGNADLF